MSTRRITSLTVSYEDGKSETWNGSGRVNLVDTTQAVEHIDHSPGSPANKVSKEPLRYVTASMTPEVKPAVDASLMPLEAAGG